MGQAGSGQGLPASLHISGAIVKFLIDECLHLSLVDCAHAAGHEAHHVNHLGLGSYKDWQLIGIIVEQDYTFVTNNRSDFLTLHRTSNFMRASS